MFLKECHLYQNQLCVGVGGGAVRNADLWSYPDLLYQHILEGSRNLQT